MNEDFFKVKPSERKILCQADGCDCYSTIEISFISYSSRYTYAICDKHFEEFKRLTDTAYDNFKRLQDFKIKQTNDLNNAKKELFK